MSRGNPSKKLGAIIARAWSDAEFKARLLDDAGSVIEEAGLSVADGVTIKAVSNSESVLHLVIPAGPTGPTDRTGDDPGGLGGLICEK